MNRHDRLAQASQDRKKSRQSLKFQAQKARKEELRRALAEQIQRILPDLTTVATQFGKAIEDLGKVMQNMKIDPVKLPSPYVSDPANETEQEKAWRAYATSRRWA